MSLDNDAQDIYVLYGCETHRPNEKYEISIRVVDSSFMAKQSAPIMFNYSNTFPLSRDNKVDLQVDGETYPLLKEGLLVNGSIGLLAKQDSFVLLMPPRNHLIF